MEVSCRFLDPASETEITRWLDLYRICFNQHASRRFWSWLHLENHLYLKNRPLIVLGVCDGNVAGALSLIPSPLRNVAPEGIGTVTSCIVCKAMVHPDYQGHGVFRTMLMFAISAARSEGYDLLVTYSNNPISYRGFIRAGFGQVTTIVQSKCYLGPQGPFAGILDRLPGTVSAGIGYPLGWIYRQFLPRPDPGSPTGFHELPECCNDIVSATQKRKPGGTIRGLRTPAFVRWRFSYPGFRFRCLSISEDGVILAYAIVQYREKGKTAMILDLFVRNDRPRVIRDLIGALAEGLRSEGIHSLQAYLPDQGDRVSGFFSFRNGFIRKFPGTGTGLIPRMLVLPLREDLPLQDLTDRKSWELQAADTCLFWAG